MKKITVIFALLAIPALAHADIANTKETPGITPDVVYGHKDGMALTYDVLAPAGKSNGAGVLFMVSGGWVSRWSPPESSRRFTGDLLDSGFTVFLVRHGSSPRFKVPDAVADVQKAVAHIYENAADFGVDPDRLGVFGGSAGGHLSLMLGCATGPVGEEPDAAAKSGKGRVAAVVAYFPPVDLQPIVGNPSVTNRFPALEFPKDRAAYVSPLLHVTSDDPPTLLVHGDKDDLVPISASETMIAALKKANVTSDFITIKGGGHGFRGEGAAQAQAALVAWFEKHLTN
jgi:acetyl esterase/lipase